MRAILISINPKWVAKILNGEKTIEIRKTMPKCDLPIDVYIYCTKDKSGDNNGNVIGRCYPMKTSLEVICGRGKVIAKFTLNKVEEIKLPYTKFGSSEWVGCEEERTLQTQTMNEETLLEKGCLEEDEIYKYLNFKKSPNNVGYAWHISNLVIFDKPKELEKFKVKAVRETCRWCPNFYEYGYRCTKSCEYLKPLTKSPQSWQFIEVD